MWLRWGQGGPRWGLGRVRWSRGGVKVGSWLDQNWVKVGSKSGKGRVEVWSRFGVLVWCSAIIIPL